MQKIACSSPAINSCKSWLCALPEDGVEACSVITGNKDDK